MRFGIAATIVAIFLSSTSVISEAATDTYKVPVADFSGLAGLQDYVSENLSPELKSAIRQQGLAIWAYTTNFESEKGNYCFAAVGITHAEEKNRNSRTPANIFTTVAKRKVENWDANDCQAEQLRDAIKNLNAEKLEAALSDVESTKTDGGTRRLKKADRSISHLHSRNLPNSGTKAVFEVMDEYPLAEVFDYRYVQTFVSDFTLQFDDGERVCIAIAGMTAKNPENRQSRWPGSTVAQLQFNQKDDCRTSTAVGAVKLLLDEPWTAKGIFNNFSRTREDGAPLPDVSAAAKKQAILLEKKTMKSERVESSQRNQVSCTNECSNGSCIRTFPNGRKEHWQAPRKFNVFSGNWEWDVNSCGG